MSYGDGLSDFLKNQGIQSLGSLTDVVNHVGLPDWLTITNDNPDAWDIGQMMLYRFFTPRIRGYVPDTYDPKCQGKKIVLDVRREFNQNTDFFEGVYHWCAEHKVDPRDFVLLTGNMLASELLDKFIKQSMREGNVVMHRIQIYSDPYYFSYLNYYLSEFYEYVRPTDAPIHRRFKCFNNWSKPHRLMLYLQLKSQNLVQGNSVSYLNNDGFSVDHNSERFQDFMADHKDDIQRHTDIFPEVLRRFPEHSEFYSEWHDSSDFPIRADDFDSNTHHHIYFNYPEEWVDRTDLSLEQRQSERAMSFPYDDIDFDIVTETVGDADEWLALFVTEKTLKPMLFGVPVFVVAPQHTLRMIQEAYGIESFSPWIDESYDFLPDLHDRISHIVTQVSDIMSYSDTEYRTWLTNVRAIAHRNREHIIKNLQ